MTNTSRNRPRMPEDPDERVGLIRSLIDRLQLAWRLFQDGRVNLGLKLIPLLSVVYIFSPLDILSEVLFPVLGPLVIADDLTIIVAGLTLFIQSAPTDVVTEHLRAIRSRLTSGEADPSADVGEVVDVDAEVLD
ncbi:MAG: hypothetical protein GYB64_08235 [Chloroflexi bacterium]|nr:hypothetical protein [Chloroflexota bacterium]